MLKGTLAFSDDALGLKDLEARLQEAFDPLVARIKNNTLPVGYSASAAIGEDGQIDRRALELQVFTDLVARDSRFSASAAEWARTFQQVKDMALEGRPPDDIFSVLERDLSRRGPSERGDAA